MQLQPKDIFGFENIEIIQVSEIEHDVVRVTTKRLDECQQYDITIVPRCIMSIL